MKIKARGKGVVLRVLVLPQKIKNILVGIALLLSSVLAWHLCYTAGQVSSFFITNDYSFSESINQSIQDSIEQKINLSGANLLSELKNDFPMVDQLVVRRAGLNKVHVQVSASDLVWRLGTTFVLTSSGEVHLSNCFKASVLRTLPKVHMHVLAEAATDIVDAQKQFLLKLQDFVIANYMIHWHGPNKIIFIDKENSERRVIVRADQKITLDILQTSKRLFSEYQKHANKTCKGTVSADMRFDGQVIVSC